MSMMGKLANFTHDFALARHEHAYRLRTEGLRLDEIGARMGVSRERARQLIKKHERQLKWASQHQRLIQASKAYQRERAGS
jgi:RNA-binding protein YlmH